MLKQLKQITMNKEQFLKLSVFLNENEYTNAISWELLFYFASCSRMSNMDEHIDKHRFETFCDFAFDEASIEHHTMVFDKVFLDKELDTEEEQCLFAHLDK